MLSALHVYSSNPHQNLMMWLKFSFFFFLAEVMETKQSTEAKVMCSELHWWSQD